MSKISLLILKTILLFPAEQASKLHCPHKELDEALKSLLGNLSKQVSLIQEYLLFDYKSILHQVSERQASELSHATFLQLNINTNDGVETLNIGKIFKHRNKESNIFPAAFDTAERKNEWEEAFVKTKEKLEDTGENRDS